MTDHTPDGDTCRTVDIGGETIRVRGARQMTDRERGYLAEIVGAARRRYAAEHPDTECPASTSGTCLGEAQSETACDTDAGECVHGGHPAESGNDR